MQVNPPKDKLGKQKSTQIGGNNQFLWKATELILHQNLQIFFFQNVYTVYFPSEFHVKHGTIPIMLTQQLL